MPGIIPVTGNVPLPTLAYRGFVAVESVSNNHTHSSYTSSDEDASRRLIAGVGYAANEITGVTIFGVTASLLVSANNGPRRCSLWIADVPTGTSGSVVLTLTSAGWNSYVSLYSVVDLVSSTPVDTDTGTGVSSVSTSVSVSDGGVAMSAVFGTALSVSWSGLTEDVDHNSATLVFSSASLGSTAPPTLSPVATIGSGTAVACVTASFR